MNYKKKVKELAKRGSLPGLEAMIGLLRELGNPQDQVRVIHIAGTNGKGSVSAFIDSVLQEAGYQVGRYLSPVIASYEEKFQINGSLIHPDVLEELFKRVLQADAQSRQKGTRPATLFEIETAIAFLWFAECKVDFALIECGMGGLEDATNVIKAPFLSVITSISYDHMQFLGETLTEIAGQKAGIIKKDCPVVLAENPPEVVQVIKEEAKARSAPLTLVKKEDYHILEERYDGNTFIYKGESYHIPLPGRHQISNAVTAIKSLRIILEKIKWENNNLNANKNTNRNTDENKNSNVNKNANANTNTNKNANTNTDKNANAKANENPNASKNTTQNEHINCIQTGLRKTSWPGRLEIIGRNPLTYRDGAHNADGAAALAAFVEKHFTNRRIIYIMGILSDKEYQKMVESLIPSGESFYVFTPANDRGLPADQLASVIRGFGKKAIVMPNVKSALEAAKEAAGPEDVLIVSGSLSFMKDM